MRLIITEKPSMAYAYARALGVKEKKDGYIEGKGNIISWCLGHMEEMASPEVYDEKYATWRKEDLPIIPGKTWKYVIPKPKQTQFKTLKALMERGDVSEVVNACDAGREGELIFRNLYNIVGCSKPMKRLWLSSMEEDAIREGFENLHDGSEYDSLSHAALCLAISVLIRTASSSPFSRSAPSYIAITFSSTRIPDTSLFINIAFL